MSESGGISSNEALILPGKAGETSYFFRILWQFDLLNLVNLVIATFTELLPAT